MNLTALQELAAQQTSARASAQRFADDVRRAFGDRVHWIRLYGSLARGDWMGPDESDVDVAIVLRDKTAEDVSRIIHLTTEHLLRTGFVFSPQIFSPVEFQQLQDRELRLARDILDEGHVL